MLIQQILVGAIAIAIGVVTLKYNFQIGNMIKLQWIESKVGSGSTFLVFKLLSILLVLAGIVYMAGFGDDIIDWATAPLQGLFRPRR